MALMSADGHPNAEIAAQFAAMPFAVTHWRKRFASGAWPDVTVSREQDDHVCMMSAFVGQWRCHARHALLDTGTRFLDLSQLVACSMHNDGASGAGAVACIGSIAGQACWIVCNHATMRGGTSYPVTPMQKVRSQENNLPCLYLVDLDGANLPNQDGVFPDRDHFFHIFYNRPRSLRRAFRKSQR